MSKHTSRKSRWTQINSKEYRSTFGVVRYHAGAWEGTAIYELWQQDGLDESQASWQARSAPAGRFKRPRNAMMAVEDTARALRRQYQDRVKIAFED